MKLNPVDEWWNRNFPPHSTRRLLFLLAWVPAFSTLTLWVASFLTGLDFSWLLVLYLSMSTGLMILLGWTTVAGQLGSSERTPPKTPGTQNARTPARICPQSPKSVFVKPGSPWIEFALTTPIFFVGFAVALLLMELDFSGEQLVIALAAALVLGLVVSTRFSRASLVAVTLLIGLGGAVFLQIFFLFLSDDDNFLIWWAVSTALAFAVVYPPWRSLQQNRERWEAIPGWAIATGAACLLMLTAAMSQVLVL